MTEAFESVYALVFFSTAIALLLLERRRRWQRQPVAIARRWTSNLGLFVIGSVVTGLVFPVGVIALAEHRSAGPLERLGLPFALELVATFLLLDLWRYWEHRVWHRVPLLWRFHLVHHSDTHVDVTTSERHHPVEAVLGTAVLSGIVLLLGFSAPALAVYLLVATVVALYSHANLRLPARFERALRRYIVTVPVHAMHHSSVRAHTDSNYGSVLTLWDRCFGTYVDPDSARIPHVGLEYFHRTNDTRLGRVLQQPLLFRRNLHAEYPPREDAGAHAWLAETNARFLPVTLTAEWLAVLLGGAIGCALVILGAWPAVVDMTTAWQSEPYQYAWLVVPMLAYMAWSTLRSTGLQVRPQPGFAGVLVVLVAAVVWIGAASMNLDVGRELAFVLALQGIALSTLGWRLYRRSFPAWALLFLMVPAGDLLQPVLRWLTLESIDGFATLARLPHSLDGYVVFIGTHRYIVVDECSGLSYVTLGSFLGYCFGLLLYRSFGRIAGLALLGAGVGILTNVVRVNAIVLIDWVRGSQMDLSAHGTIQWIALLAALAVLFYVLGRLEPEPSVAAPPLAGGVSPPHRFAPAAAVVSGLLIVGSAAAWPAHDPPAPGGSTTAAFPRAVGGWTLAGSGSGWVADPQGGSESFDLTYAHDDSSVQVVVVDALSATSKLPEGRLAPGDSSIWREKRISTETGCADGECMTMRHAIWQRDRSREVQHVYAAYSIDGHLTASRLAARASQGWARLTGRHPRPRLVGIASAAAVGDAGALAALFVALQATAERPSLAEPVATR